MDLAGSFSSYGDPAAGDEHTVYLHLLDAAEGERLKYNFTSVFLWGRCICFFLYLAEYLN